MARGGICFLAGMAALLRACTLEPNYQRPPSPVPASPGGTAARKAAADIGWREFFLDAQLQRLIALALTNNRDLRVAALNVQTAQAQYRIQRADLFPTVDASAVEQVQHIPSVYWRLNFPAALPAEPGRQPATGLPCTPMTSESASRITSSISSAASAA